MMMREGKQTEKLRIKILSELTLVSSGVRVAVKQNTAHWHFRCHAKSYIKSQHY